MNKKIIFLLIIFLIGCVPQQVIEEDKPLITTPTIQSTAVNTLTPQPAPTIIPPSGTLPATETLSSSQTSVTISAAGGNLYIRRGPDLAYSRIGVLEKGESAQVIGQDMLSNWVQIKIPNSEITGWVSLMTQYSEVNGDLKTLPNFTFTDFPQPAYIINCTEHELHIEPGEYYLYNLFTHNKSLNEIRVDSGVYYIYDATLPKVPLIKTVDLQEGETAYITVNGLGEGHKCP